MKQISQALLGALCALTLSLQAAPATRSVPAPTGCSGAIASFCGVSAQCVQANVGIFNALFVSGVTGGGGAGGVGATGATGAAGAAGATGATGSFGGGPVAGPVVITGGAACVSGPTGGDLQVQGSASIGGSICLGGGIQFSNTVGGVPLNFYDVGSNIPLPMLWIPNGGVPVEVSVPMTFTRIGNIVTLTIPSNQAGATWTGSGQALPGTFLIEDIPAEFTPTPTAAAIVAAGSVVFTAGGNSYSTLAVANGGGVIQFYLAPDFGNLPAQADGTDYSIPANEQFTLVYTLS